jgi:hypothetical protein
LLVVVVQLVIEVVLVVLVVLENIKLHIKVILLVH